MLMDCAREFRHLRAPLGDGQTFVEPDYSLLPEIVRRNRQRLTDADYDVQGRSVRDISKSARRSLLQFAYAYTSQYRDVPERWQSDEAIVRAPFILSGHQPEMFHPGVWYKNFVLGGLARRLNGVGIHLLIDSDLCRSASIRVPTGTFDDPRVEAVPYDKPAPEAPYEERIIHDTAVFSSFAERATSLIRPFVADPMAASLWPLTVLSNPRQTNLGLRLAQGRHAFEQTWHNETLELPQSAVCQLPEFAWFTAHLLAQLPRFWSAHNDALALYRCAHHMRNRAQPVPDLAAFDDWLEAPFWIWTSEDSQRRPLYARQAGNAVVISDRHAHTISLPLTEDGDATAAAEQLAALSSRGIKLRTRALTTTLFARLVLSDLFLHGIGGAKYDQVTDHIVRLFFGFEPPEFATVSATLRLPLQYEAHDDSLAGQWEQRLRELRYHPERFVDFNDNLTNGEAAAVADIVATKQRWLRTPKTVENALARHRAIVNANDQLQPFIAPLREQIEGERDASRHRKRGEAILRSREYSFCLYPRRHFEELFRDPRL
jgi:hypothetical protein